MYDYNCPDCNEAKLQSDKNARKINEIIGQVNQIVDNDIATTDYLLEKADEIVGKKAKVKVNAEIGNLNSEIDNIQKQVNDLVLGAVGDGNNAEVVQARGGYDVLNDRLNKNDIYINAVSKEVWELQPSIINDGYTKIDGSSETSNYNMQLDVTSGEEYWIKTVSGWDLKPYVLLNSNNTVVGYYKTTENSQVYHNYVNNIIKIRIPTDCTKLVVNSFDTAYLECKKYAFTKVNSENIKELPSEIVGMDNLVNNISSLFGENYNNLSFTTETGFMEASGKLNTSTAFHAKIPVLKGEKYRIITNYGYNMGPYVIINNVGSIVDYLPSDSPSNVTTKTHICEVLSDGYLYVNTYTATILSIQKLVGYKVVDSSTNILNGKKVIFFGDSITEGNGSWADTGTIRNKNNMTGSNFGVGGSKYTVTSSADNLNCIYNRIKAQYSTNSDADYIILSGLVNDALQSMPIGSMLSKTDFTTECDASTVYGAYEMALRYVLENWKGAKVGVIITPNIPSSSNLNEYFDVARNVCKKYSVPYLDLYENSGLCVGIESIKETYYKGDDIHPNADGYAKYINDKVESFMKTL